MKFKNAQIGTMLCINSIFSSVLATFLFAVLSMNNAFGQEEKKTEQTFIFKDRFISSGGFFFAQPISTTAMNNYTGISFSPQLNFLNSFSDFSIAFASPIDIGYKISNDNNSSSKMMASIPAIFVLNLGHLASRDFYSAFGLFVGGGLDFGFLNGAGQQGVMWTAGLRTWFLKKSFTLRYSQVIFDQAATMRVFSLQLNLGKYIKQVYRNNQISHFEKPMH